MRRGAYDLVLMLVSSSDTVDESYGWSDVLVFSGTYDTKLGCDHRPVEDCGRRHSTVATRDPSRSYPPPVEHPRDTRTRCLGPREGLQGTLPVRPVWTSLLHRSVPVLA